MAAREIIVKKYVVRHLMHSVAVGEDVMCRFPIAVLIRRAKPRDPQRRRITQRAAEVGA